ncbi:MAG: hypothetical protein KatS3mg010_1238 [Acidimicrobiia bacterium]|nr:MAG: hypothetical protein KatS3mg010_1238 [Acidimicrobiia bacterium]
MPSVRLRLSWPTSRNVPARRDGFDGARPYHPSVLVGHLEVGEEHQIEGASGRLVLDQVGDAELDGHVPRRGEPARLVDRDLREVDAGDLPAAGRQPHGVAALAAREVERTTGWQPGTLGRHEAVRLEAPHHLVRGVAVVPVVPGPRPEPRI